jgi:class 3 adenylate cyclase
LLALILASVVEASASSRMAVLATSLQRAGGVIVGASGQRIMITLGLSAGWIRAISIVSPD